MNESETNRFVVVISGTSGAGKTSLVRKTAALLGDAVCLHFDDYRSVSRYPQPDLARWLRDGADPDEWMTPVMAEDLRQLRAGTAISLPDNLGPLEPRPYIVVEDPFGRSRREVAPYIDLAAFIDIPLEIALARKILRETAGESHRNEPGKMQEYVHSFLEAYLNVPIRDVYLRANESAKASSDFVLDGMLPIENLAREITAHVHAAHLPTADVRAADVPAPRTGR